MALRVAARAWIPISIPRPADAGAGFKDKRREPQPIAQAMELVEPGEAGSDNESVEQLSFSLPHSFYPSCRSLELEGIQLIEQVPPHWTIKTLYACSALANWYGRSNPFSLGTMPVK